MKKKLFLFLILCLGALSLLTVGAAYAALVGDANGDGAVSSRDAVAIKQHIVSLSPLSAEGEALADVNADGKINSRDAVLIEQFLVGMSVSFGKAEVFTVTFLDIDGNVVKTERVPFGEAATPPEMADTENAVFLGWNKPFDNVTADVTVAARYRLRATYTVTFLDGYGRILSAQTVKEGLAAEVPAPPQREGYTFLGWSADTACVAKSMTVTPLYRLEEGDNILDFSYLFHENGSVTLTVSAVGNVRFAGLQMKITLPDAVTPLTYAVLDNDDIIHLKDRTLNVVFTNITDLTEKTDILTLTFTVNEQTKHVTFGTEVVEMYDEHLGDVPYRVIGCTLACGEAD